ncbi:MAG TPA: cation diffusion facilitator family transporter [Candidatus Binatia bacterium]
MSRFSKMGEQHRTKFVVIIALLANLAIAASKLIAALITGSSAMLAETAHTFADTGNQLTLLLGLRLAQRPPDPQHPFGYGKERYFWPFMASISMFIIGGSFSVFRGIERILSPHELQDIRLNYVVLGVSAIFDGTSFSLAFMSLRQQLLKLGLWKAIRVTKDPILFSVFFEDSAGLLGLALAFIGLFLYQLTGIVIFDSLASVFIGLLLGAVALLLGYESRSLLLGEAASPETRQKIVDAVRRVPEVVDVAELLTMHMAPDDILVNMDLNLKGGLTTAHVEETIDRIEDEIRKTVPQARRIFIECETLRRARQTPVVE